MVFFPYRDLPPAIRRRILIGTSSVAAIVLIGGGVWFGLSRRHPATTVAVTTSPTPTPTAATPTPPTPTPTPVTVPSHLSGLAVAPGTEDLRPLAVMIENTPEARPQAGLGEADIVYEAVAEGGITRFMAVYGNASTPVTVGPVRSARPYYVDFAQELGAMYAHAGGSQLGLAEISNTGVPNLDGLAIGAPIFYRSNPHNVASEHTLYSSTDKLWNYAASRYTATGTYTPWKFAADTPASAPTSTKITTSVSAAPYNVEWDYDAASNSYLRSEGGAPHIDMNTNKQIAVKNVILETAKRIDSTESYGSITKPISLYTITGSGQALIFQNGIVTKGTWKKDGSNRTIYSDADGNEISFVAGETWIQLVESSSKITY